MINLQPLSTLPKIGISISVKNGHLPHYCHHDLQCHLHQKEELIDQKFFCQKSHLISYKLPREEMSI